MRLILALHFSLTKGYKLRYSSPIKLAEYNSATPLFLATARSVNVLNDVFFHNLLHIHGTS